MIALILSGDPEFDAFLEARFQEMLAADEQAPTSAYKLTEKGAEVARRMRERHNRKQESTG